jgi:type I site-specific restriction endonuclease
MNDINPTASLGVAVREYPTNAGEADYVLFIDRVPVGVIEAKATDKGEKLINVAEQSLGYAKSGLKYFIDSKPLRFTYEATDILTCFCDLNDINARTRPVFSFHKPETLRDWINSESTLRNHLRTFPPFDSYGFRDCQTRAITSLEKSFAENRPRALIQMATGAGKTFTAITSVYRLLKYANAKRILFLVDTRNLGEQAEEEFRKYKSSDDAQLFPELYNLQRLHSAHIPADTHLCISTIQRMYSILRGEERDVVNPSQIRNIIRAFKEKVLTEMFPLRKEVPKTLVFAKTDSHADDIIGIIREEFGEGNNFFPDRHNFSPEIQQEKTIEILARNAVKPICSPKLREFILNARKAHDQIIDPTIDTIINADWKEDIEQRADEAIHKFKQFIEDNKNEITALNIIYSQAYRNRLLTYKMIEELYAAMHQAPYFFTVDKLWQAYSVKFSDIE